MEGLTGKKISEVPVLDKVIGDELIPYAKNGRQGSIASGKFATKEDLESIGGGGKTTSDNVTMTDGSGTLTDSLNKRTTEYNVSLFHPTSGEGGGNKYTLETALVQVPAELRNVGVKVSFLNAEEKPESWEFQGGTWGVSAFLQSGAGKVENIEKSQGTEMCLYSGGFSFLNKDGIETPEGNGKNHISDFIEVSTGKAFKYSLGVVTDGSACTVLAAYDANKTFLPEKSVMVNGSTKIVKGHYVTEEGVKYIRLCYNIGLKVSCISAPKVQYPYLEEVQDLIDNAETSSDRVKDENVGKTQAEINADMCKQSDSILMKTLHGYGVVVTKENFVLKNIYGNDGTIYSSDTHLSTRPVRIRVADLNSTLFEGKGMGYSDYYNCMIAWKDDPEIHGYSGSNKLYNMVLFPHTDTVNSYIDLEAEEVYISFSLPVTNISENTILKFGLYKDYVEKKYNNICYHLGSLAERTNCIIDETEGYGILDNGQVLEPSFGGANYKVTTAVVQSGKTYYLYEKLADNSVKSVELVWATEKNEAKLNSSLFKRYGSSSEITIQEGEEYLLVSSGKGSTLMISDKNGLTQYFEPENTSYILLQQLQKDVEDLKKEDETVENLPLSFNNLRKNPIEQQYSGSDFTISDASNKSSIPDYTEYKAQLSGEKLNPIFRFSSPACRIKTELYPNNLVADGRTPNLGFTVEFYCSASSFEIIGFTNYFAGILIDGKILGFKSGQLSGTNYILVNLGTAKKRLVRLYLTSLSFYGVRCNNDGEITAMEKKRFLCAFDGDSVVEGSNSENNAGKWAQIASVILDVDCFNTAMGGTGYGKEFQQRLNMVDRFENQIAQYKPDILIVSAGINDADEGFETYVDNYYSQAKQMLPDCHIIVCSNYFNKTESDSNWSKAEAKCEILRKTALKYELPFIDYLHRLTYDALGNLLTNNIGTSVNTNLITEENYSQFIDADYDITHPTQFGHTVMGKYIGNEVFKILKDLKGFMI